ncbi:MAG: DUF1289 domain-containing protein [Xenophilus sp.]
MTGAALHPVLARAPLVRAAVAQGLEPVPSPCIGVCRMDAASGLCEGCRRTLDEITRWRTLDDAARLALWARVEERIAGAAP